MPNMTNVLLSGKALIKSNFGVQFFDNTEHLVQRNLYGFAFGTSVWAVL